MLRDSISSKRALLALILALTIGPAVSAGPNKNFAANLSGADEVPARQTHARGHTHLQVNAEGTEIFYRLTATNIHNVVAAHIHVGQPGANGPVVAFLAGPFPPGGGRHSGVLATGTITEEDLVGPLAGHSLSELLEAMNSGNAYVNVHTNDGVGAPNSGPGDFPGGEIRGQIR